MGHGHFSKGQGHTIMYHWNMSFTKEHTVWVYRNNLAFLHKLTSTKMNLSS